jgi:hypothetical protein
MGAEDAQMVVEGMAQAGVEPTYCMGDDIPLAVLSDKPHMLYNYFKQRFAQVLAAADAVLCRADDATFCFTASESLCCAGRSVVMLWLYTYVGSFVAMLTDVLTPCFMWLVHAVLFSSVLCRLHCSCTCCGCTNVPVALCCVLTDVLKPLLFLLAACHVCR